jgi:hypothetical protein
VVKATEDESEVEEDDDDVASDSEAPKSSVPFEFLVEFEEGALLTLQSIDDMIGAIVSLLLGLDYASRIFILQALRNLTGYAYKLSKIDISDPKYDKKVQGIRKPDPAIINLVNLLGPLILLKNNRNIIQKIEYKDLDHLKIRIARGEDDEIKIFLLPTLDVCCIDLLTI